MIHLIDEYKPYILNGIECNGTAKEDCSMRSCLTLRCESPFSVSWVANVIIGWELEKFSPDNLLIDYNDLEDYEGKELTILAKLESRKYYKDTPLPVFDIYKDFLGLNRALRKANNINKKARI